MGKHERPRPKGLVKAANVEEPAPDTPREPIPAPATAAEVQAAEVQQRGRLVYIQPLWQERLGLLAGKSLVSPSQYLEGLIRRAWVASGAGKGQP